MRLGSGSTGGLGGLLSDVMRIYEQRLQEKDQRIAELEAEVADLLYKLSNYENEIEWCEEHAEDDQ